MRADIDILLECLRSQLPNPSLLCQSLVNLATQLSTGPARIYFCQCGGLKYVYHLLTQANMSDIQTAALFCLASAVENSDVSQKVLTQPVVFYFLRELLLEAGASCKLRQAAIYFLLCLVANNCMAQVEVKESGCLAELIQIFRQVVGDLKNGLDIGPLNMVTSALSVCVHNPQNEENQWFCGSLLPSVLSLVTTVSDIQVLSPVLSMLRLVLADCARNQDRVRKCGGLDMLTTRLCGLVDTGGDDNLTAAVHVVRTLDACLSDNEANIHQFVEKCGTRPLFALLKPGHLSQQEQLQVVITLSHVLQDKAGVSRLMSVEDYQKLVYLLTQATQDQLIKAVKYVLHLCQETDSGDQEEKTQMKNQKDMLIHSNDKILQRIDQLSAKIDLYQGESARQDNDSNTYSRLEPSMSSAIDLSSSRLPGEETNSLLQQLRQLVGETVHNTGETVHNTGETEASKYTVAQSCPNTRPPSSMFEDGNLSKMSHSLIPYSGMQEDHRLLDSLREDRKYFTGASVNAVQLLSDCNGFVESKHRSDNGGNAATSWFEQPWKNECDRQACPSFQVNSNQYGSSNADQVPYPKQGFIDSHNYSRCRTPVQRNPLVVDYNHGNSDHLQRNRTVGSHCGSDVEYGSLIPGESGDCNATGTRCSTCNGRGQIMGYLKEEDGPVQKDTSDSDVWQLACALESCTRPNTDRSRTEPHQVQAGSLSTQSVSTKSDRNPGFDRQTVGGDVQIPPVDDWVIECCQTSPVDISPHLQEVAVFKTPADNQIIKCPQSSSVNVGPCVQEVTVFKTPASMKPTNFPALRRVRTPSIAGSIKCVSRSATVRSGDFAQKRSKTDYDSSFKSGDASRSRASKLSSSSDKQSEKNRCRSTKQMMPRSCGFTSSTGSITNNVRMQARRSVVGIQADIRGDNLTRSGAEVTREQIAISGSQPLKFSKSETSYCRNGEKSTERGRRRPLSHFKSWDTPLQSLSKSIPLCVTPIHSSTRRSRSVPAGLRSATPACVIPLQSSMSSPAVLVFDQALMTTGKRSKSAPAQGVEVDAACTPVVKKLGGLSSKCWTETRLPTCPAPIYSKSLSMHGWSQASSDYDSDSDTDSTSSCDTDSQCSQSGDSRDSQKMKQKDNVTYDQCGDIKQEMCPGCHPPSEQPHSTLNSRTYNIAVETSIATCDRHRLIRATERDFISKLKSTRGALHKPRPLPALGERLVPVKSCPRPTTGLSVFSFHTSSGESEEDRRMYVSPPLSRSSMSKKLAVFRRRHGRQLVERRERVDYSMEEVENLCDGVDKLGTRWNQILITYKFHPSRTAIDLQEKYKRMKKQEKKQENNNRKPKEKVVRQGRQFSMCEERRLRRGVKSLGYNWKGILQLFRFSRGRSAEELRNRWRTIMKRA